MLIDKFLKLWLDDRLGTVRIFGWGNLASHPAALAVATISRFVF